MGSVFAVHYVNNENNICRGKIVVDLAPGIVIQRRAKVMRGDAQIELVGAIDFPLRISQRREQTRSQVKHRNVHAISSRSGCRLSKRSRNVSSTSSSGFQYPRSWASSNRFKSERSECGFRSSNLWNIIGSN